MRTEKKKSFGRADNKESCKSDNTVYHYLCMLCQ